MPDTQTMTPVAEAIRQGDDGAPHLTYYDRDRLLSFVWNGRADVIEVSHGGYGEPVGWLLPARDEAAGHSGPAQALLDFQVTCDQWVERVYDSPAGPPADVAAWGELGRRRYDESGLPDTAVVQCARCRRTWDDALVTSRTPAPAGRCPYENDHEPDGEAS